MESKGPLHIAIIPDGNRRWAKSKGMKGIMGHKKSASYENLKSLMEGAKDLGVKYITFWAFSTENWKRDKLEIKFLFNLMNKMFESVEDDLIKNKIRFRHFGRKDRIPKELAEKIAELEEKTKNFKDFNLQICLDYGGRDEILRAVNKAIRKGVELNEDDFKMVLDSAEVPDPDLIIRTSGEKRLSGFMPFQTSYSEFYFSDLYFPDFKPENLREAVEEFEGRKRNFGGN